MSNRNDHIHKGMQNIMVNKLLKDLSIHNIPNISPLSKGFRATFCKAEKRTFRSKREGGREEGGKEGEGERGGEREGRRERGKEGERGEGAEGKGGRNCD